MHTADTPDPAKALPAGCVPVAIDPFSDSVALRLCVVVRTQRDPVGGDLVSLRRTFESRVILACVVDAADCVQRWLELWIQQPPEQADASGIAGTQRTNALWDQRWRDQADAWRTADPTGTLSTGWESRHPPPMWIDRSTHKIVYGVDANSGHPLSLCQDDTWLTDHDLPAYATSCCRYLYVPKLGSDSPLIPLTAETLADPSVLPIGAVGNAQHDDLIPLNPGGGLMMARQYSPIDLEAFVDVLSGQTQATMRHGVSGRAVVDAIEPTPAHLEAGANGDGRLFLERHGLWGRLLEGYHLKIKLLTDIVSTVQNVVRVTKRPVLNLCPDSFQIRLGADGCGLPYLWTARAVLADGGDAVHLPIDTDTGQFFHRTVRDVSIYQPRSVTAPSRGLASVRIRDVETPTKDTLVVEGTLATEQRIETLPGDLACLRLDIGQPPVDLYVRLEAQQALAVGEWRFRATNQGLNHQQVQSLVAAKGLPIPQTPFEIVRHLSTPCDLYALAVLAVRVLCAHPATSLPTLLDEVLSLAGQVAQDHDASVPLERRIAAVFDRDPRWMASLGPHRLVAEAIAPDDAFDAVPAELWWQTWAEVIRMLPGIGADSTCRGWGDARSGQIHRVFDEALAGFKALLQQSRSLIVIDWQFNREVHAVVRGYLTQLIGARIGSNPVDSSDGDR